MDIDGLAESIELTQEEIDFYSWKKESKITNINFAQKVHINKLPFYIVGGSTSGNIYCQSFPSKTHISKIRFDENRPKVILHWKVLLNIINKEHKELKEKN